MNFKDFLRRAGLDISRYHHANHPLARRKRLFDHYNVRIVFDVGANTGQYATMLRRIGFDGQIVSFEPLPAAYEELARKAESDPKWFAVQLALGERDGSEVLHIAGNSQSSSFFEMLPYHHRIAPASEYCGEIEVQVRRLDSVLSNYVKEGERIFLKMDTQGAEHSILRGAMSAIDRLIGIQTEVSLVPLYEGELLLLQMVTLISEMGFELMGIEPGISDPATGRLLQADCIFFAR